MPSNQSGPDAQGPTEWLIMKRLAGNSKEANGITSDRSNRAIEGSMETTTTSPGETDDVLDWVLAPGGGGSGFDGGFGRSVMVRPPIIWNIENKKDCYQTTNGMPTSGSIEIVTELL